MKKDGMNKFYFLVGIVALIVVLFFIFSSGGSNPVKTNTNSGTGQIKEFNMTAKQFEFIPNKITVNVGDTVILHITSTDVAHGIAIPQFGVSQQLPPGQEETVQFVADKAGTYTFYCNVFCGSGHRSMIGSLVVQ